MKKNKKFSEEYLESLLTNIANLNDYYILQESPNDTGGLIHYRSLNGKLYMYVQDNDDLAIACIQFLKKRGVPIFTDIASLKKYEEKLVNSSFS